MLHNLELPSLLEQHGLSKDDDEELQVNIHDLQLSEEQLQEVLLDRELFDGEIVAELQAFALEEMQLQL